MTLREFLPRLKNPTKTASGFEARCPAHEDKRASLSVTQTPDGKILLHCHAGCTFDAICAALSLKPGDLFPASNGKASQRHEVAAYDYPDETGKLLFQVVRFEPKDFRQRQPDRTAKDGWRWKMKGVRRVLYRLPDVVKAVANGTPVVLAEGEKDVAALVEHGFCASCNPGGAGKWQDGYTETLRGAEVVILPDDDEPGRKHAELVALRLHATAKRIRVVTLPDVPNAFGLQVKDAYDFFHAGGTAEELRALINAAPDWIPGTKIAPETKPQPRAEQPSPQAQVEAAESSDQGSPIDKRGAVSLLILPSGSVSITESAKEIFGRVAASQSMFWRGCAIVEVIQQKGIDELKPLSPDAFRSRVERFGNLFAWKSAGEGKPVLKQTRMPRDTAVALLATADARELLPPVSSVLRCPVMIESGKGEVSILGRGYHQEQNGLLIVAGGEPPRVELAEAVGSLHWIVNEFDFQSEGDVSRALSSLITPGLRMGGLLKGNVPIDIAEADQSQAGKGYRFEQICALYNEFSYVVTSRTGGVGSVDESFAAALIAGRPFICLDNFRGKLDSQHLEAFVTAPGLFPARVPHCGEAMIDPKKFLLQMTSNGFESTRDLANRSSICRIRKRPGFGYRDTVGEIKQRQPYFLGCVFAVIGEWLANGKPRTSDTRHDFREWSQTLDWIVQNILGCAPLLDGHTGAQERVSNSGLSWLRAVAFTVEREGKLGVPFLASELIEMAEAHGLDVPGEPKNEEEARKQVGRLCRRVFHQAEAVELDGFQIARSVSNKPRPEGGAQEVKHYAFSKLL